MGVDGLHTLHALYALALRRSCAALMPDVSSSSRPAWTKLRIILTRELSELRYDRESIPAQHANQLARAILRGHALRCYAVLLAEAAEQLAPSPAPGQGARQPARCSRRSFQAALDTLTQAQQLLVMFKDVLSTEGNVGPGATALRRELGSELAASGLLEHWAHLLLLITATRCGMDAATLQLHTVSKLLFSLSQRSDATWWRSMCELLLRSPSLSYLLSSHVVGLCAALDGGPTYGMPAAAADDEWVEWEDEEDGKRDVAPSRAVAPLFTSQGLRLRRWGASGGIGTELAQWALSVWTEAMKSHRQDSPAEPQQQEARRCGFAAVPPLSAAATFELCMRLAAVDAGAAAVPPAFRLCEAGGEQPRGAANLGAPGVAKRALRCGREALGAAVFAAAELGPAKEWQLRRWWLALVAFIDSQCLFGQPRLSMRSWSGLEECLVVPSPPPGLPARPSPCIAAALEAGYLPRLDVVIHTLAGCSEPLRGLLPLPAGRWVWAQLLAFGDQHETAALVRGMANLLRCAAVAAPPPQPQPQDSEAPGVQGGPQIAAPYKLVAAMESAAEMSRGVVSLFHRASMEEIAASAGSAAPNAADSPPAAGSAAAAGLPRMCLMMSYMTMHMLPHLQDALLLQALPACCARREDLDVCIQLLRDLLLWMLFVTPAVLLARKQAAAAHGSGPHGGTAAQAAEGTSGAAAQEDWSAVLCRQLPPLLGWVLGLLVAGRGTGAPWVQELATTASITLFAGASMAPREYALALGSSAAQDSFRAATGVAAAAVGATAALAAGPASTAPDSAATGPSAAVAQSVDIPGVVAAVLDAAAAADPLAAAATLPAAGQSAVAVAASGGVRDALRALLGPDGLAPSEGALAMLQIALDAATADELEAKVKLMDAALEQRGVDKDPVRAKHIAMAALLVPPMRLEAAMD